jgi:hypothetical protein
MLFGFLSVVSSHLSKFLNQGLVRLIPKNANTNFIEVWWPIILLIVAYKIMA